MPTAHSAPAMRATQRRIVVAAEGSEAQLFLYGLVDLRNGKWEIGTGTA
jgi:hypothetical protein